MSNKFRIVLPSFLMLFIFLCSCTAQKKADEKVNDTENQIDDESYEAARREYVSGYEQKQTIDTTVQLGGAINFKLTHYCLFDTLVIPSKYSWSENPSDFSTHNFASRITISKDGKAIVDTLVKKQAFDQILSPELKSYGVLLNPNYRGFDGGIFKIQYSLSIPLTDVGKSVVLEITTDGKTKVTEE